jgi:serine protease Do
MNAKKIIMSCLLILLIASSLFAQLRDYIPVVRPVYDRRLINFLNELSYTLSWDGYDDMADMTAAYATGGYGSGFVFVATDGANYIVTNYHVVAEAGSVNLEFEQEDGTLIVYQNCSVFAVDKTTDLALIRFPDNKRPFRSGLSFSAARIKDGMEVWTAGYPGLIDKPMWQLGKGNITNAHAKVPELVDPKITSLIQHSAQVDPGNSGGPLLVVDRSSTGGFRVIGINTWKVVGRQATNFSIPADVVKSFIHKSLTGRPEDKKEEQSAAALESACRRFTALWASAAKPYKDIARFFSREYGMAHGKNILTRVLKNAPEPVVAEIRAAFFNISPMEGVRMAFAYSLYSAAGDKKAATTLTFARIDEGINPATGKAGVYFNLGDKELSSTWVYESGRWSISSFALEDESIAEEKKAENKAEFHLPYDYLFCAGAQLYFDDLAEPAWMVGYYYAMNDYISWGVELGLLFLTGTDDLGVEVSSTTFKCDLVGRLHVPLNLSAVTLIPYLTAGIYGMFNMDLSYENGYLGGVGGGIQLAFSENPVFVLGSEYLYGFNILGFEEGTSQSAWISVYLAVEF